MKYLIISIIVVVIIIIIFNTELFLNKDTLRLVERNTINNARIYLTGDEPQLIYDRAGPFIGSFNAKVKKYDICSGSHDVTLHRIDAHSGMDSRASDTAYQHKNSPIIAHVPKYSCHKGWVRKPTNKVMLVVVPSHI